MATAGLLFGIGPAWTHLSMLALYPIAAGKGLHVWALVATFYGVGLSPIVWVAHDYTSQWLMSLLPWFIPSAINTLALGFALSRQQPLKRALCTLLCVVLLALPPLSAVSVMSPAPLAFMGWLQGHFNAFYNLQLSDIPIFQKNTKRNEFLR